MQWSRFGRRNIVKWHFNCWRGEMKVHRLVLYTWKDSILSPECLAYWSSWLEVTPKIQVWFLAVHRSGKKVTLSWNFKSFCKFAIFLKLVIFNPILKFADLTASFSRFGVLAKAIEGVVNQKSLQLHPFHIETTLAGTNSIQIPWWSTHYHSMHYHSVKIRWQKNQEFP